MKMHLTSFFANSRNRNIKALDREKLCIFYRDNSLIYTYIINALGITI